MKYLGEKSELPNNPDEFSLEKVDNPHLDVKYVIRFTCPEFTSLCPVTSQPDFAKIIIDYVPNKFIIESKSLKLFLSSFRSCKAFHEDCTIKIAKKIIKLLDPEWLRISGYWFPRGGIPIDIFYQTSKPRKEYYIKDDNMDIYRGR